MSIVHSSLLAYIKNALSDNANDNVGKMMDGKTDHQIIRLMFSNLRGQDHNMRGLRLTNFGITVMKSYFRAYEVGRDGKKLTALEMVYLDKKARLPYWIDETGDIIIFDPDLGIKLKLADGDVSILMEIDATLATDSC